MPHREDEPMNVFDASPYSTEWSARGHVVEESIYAWLDGALGDSDSEAVQKHLAECAECSEAVAEARGYIAASARILSTMDVTPRNVVPREDAARTAARIVAMADKTGVKLPVAADELVAPTPGSKGVTTRIVSATRAAPATPNSTRAWYTRTPVRIAAGLLLMIAGTTYVTARVERAAGVRSALEAVDSADVPPSKPAQQSAAKPAQQLAAQPAQQTAAQPAQQTAAQPAQQTVAKPAPPSVPRSALPKAPKLVLPNSQKSKLAQAPGSEVAMLSGKVAGAAVQRSDSAGILLRGTGTPQALPTVKVEAQANQAEQKKLAFTVATVQVSNIRFKTIAGAVTDGRNPVPVANVFVTGTGIVTTTDANGGFVLHDIPDDAKSLQVRRIGYAMAEVSLAKLRGDSAQLNVKLTPALMMLSDVVVTSAPAASARKRDAVRSMRCVVAATGSSDTYVPIIRGMLADFGTPGTYTSTVLGWPKDQAVTKARFNVNDAGILRGEVSDGPSILVIELTPSEEGWNSTVREYRGGNVRTENIKFTSGASASVCGGRE